MGVFSCIVWKVIYIAINYEHLSLEIGQYAKIGADIMIQNEWLEQPPGTLNTEELTKKKRPIIAFHKNHIENIVAFHCDFSHFKKV